PPHARRLQAGWRFPAWSRGLAARRLCGANRQGQWSDSRQSASTFISQDRNAMTNLTKTSVWAVLLLIAAPLAAQEATWNRTLERIASGVVSIHVDSTRAFDTESNQSTQATGFVVDAENGLILTNRHVVTPGP